MSDEIFEIFFFLQADIVFFSFIVLVIVGLVSKHTTLSFQAYL